jgi:hypothetical protein
LFISSVLRLQDARHKLFTKSLRTYIENDEDVTQSIIDLKIYQQEKQLKAQHKRLETETSRGKELNKRKPVYNHQYLHRYSSY